MDLRPESRGLVVMGPTTREYVAHLEAVVAPTPNPGAGRPPRRGPIGSIPRTPGVTAVVAAR